MGISLAVKVFLLIIVGTTCMVFLLSRIIAIVDAAKLKRYCARESSEYKRNDRANRLFHSGFIAEISKTGGQLALSLFVALVILIFLWFVAADSEIREYRWLMICFQIACGAGFAIAHIAAYLVMMSIPIGLECRTQVNTAVHRHVLKLILLFLLYTVGNWIYTL